MSYLKILMFVFANGDRITDISMDCVETVKKFVEELLAEYEGQVMAMDADFVNQVAETYAAKYPELVPKCDAFAATQPGVMAIGARGAFTDLIKLILENREAIIDFINLIISFTGGSAETQSE